MSAHRRRNGLPSAVWVAGLVVVVAFGAGGCGGASPEQQAKDAVCARRADIAQSVSRLAAPPRSQLQPDRVQNELAAIAIDLRVIREQEGKADATLAQQLRAAEPAFQQQLGAVLSGLLLGGALSTRGINADLARGLDQLAASYRKTLARVDCS